MRFCSNESLIPVQATIPTLHSALQTTRKKGMKNSELLIPIPGPIERHRQPGGRNPESQCALFTLKVRIFSYNHEASTDRRPST